jgi:hypothetical protein
MITHLGNDLELLALAILGLGDGGLETLEGPSVKFLVNGNKVSTPFQTLT